MPNLIKLVEEDYCCLFGWLALCRVRGEKPKDMARNMGVPYRTVKYHYTVMNRGHEPQPARAARLPMPDQWLSTPPCSHQCQKKGVDCLHPHIVKLADLLKRSEEESHRSATGSGS